MAPTTLRVDEARGKIANNFDFRKDTIILHDRAGPPANGAQFFNKQFKLRLTRLYGARALKSYGPSGFASLAWRSLRSPTLPSPANPRKS